MAGSRDLLAKLENEFEPDTPTDAAKSRRTRTPDARGSERDAADSYTAADIEVLEGLEPVRRRPGMYIGGTDEKAMHHLFAEVIDNSMDEAIAGHATWIDVEMTADGYLCVTDNGRGVPVDPHPKFKNKSALEVIMTTLHSGGKFDGTAYKVSGGLHGVGVSAVNALSEVLEVEVARGQQLFRMVFNRGVPQADAKGVKLQQLGSIKNRRGTKVRFKPDQQIFGAGCAFKPGRLLKMARSKAYLFGGVEIRWTCAPELIKDDTPEKAVFHFPGGLKDFLGNRIEGLSLITKEPFAGKFSKDAGPGREGAQPGNVEWAVAWVGDEDGFVNSYCNTVPTPEGGTHEAGLRAALTKGLKAYGERTANKRADKITAEDVFTSCTAMLSVFIREPEFQGQTKEKLATQEASRIVESALRDAFDHWLTDSPAQATRLLEWVIETAEDRIKRRQEKDVARKTATRKLRLPGKLADCTNAGREGSELFIVEGDSAGGSAKQARDRATQAILPLRGKILNVASATSQKLAANQLLSDLIQALGVGLGQAYRDDELRYEKVIIMTDADVDGAHIASLLITFFYQEMAELIDNGHLYLAVPPLFKIKQGAKHAYALDEKHRDQLIATEFSGRGKVDVQRFKGLGEMNSGELKETTMNVAKRRLLRVAVAEEARADIAKSVSDLMGTKPEARFRFIQEHAEFARDLDI